MPRKKKRALSRSPMPMEQGPTEAEALLRKHLEDVTLRSHGFAKEIERLKAEAKQREVEANKMMKYLEEDVERKNTVNKRLTKSLKDLNTRASTEKATLKKEFEAALRRAESVFLQKEAQLLSKNKQLMRQVADLSLFQKMRHDLHKQLEATRDEIKNNEQRHKKQLDELEARFVSAKEQLQKEAAARIAHSRKVYKEEVGRELDYESKLVRQENKEMTKELKFHEARSQELMQSNDQLKAKVRTLGMELSLANQKDQEYAKQSLRQKRHIKELGGKVASLEQSMSKAVREFEMEREVTARNNKKTVDSLNKELDTLRGLTNLKDVELRKIRKHAQTLLNNRNEVEEYFLSSLQHVKNEIQRKRETDHKAAKDRHNKQIRELALPKGFKFPSIPQLAEPPRPIKKHVQLNELSLEDRERVLRLLFAKINNVSTASSRKLQLPPHAFDIQVSVKDRSQPHNSRRSVGEVGKGGATFLTDMDLDGPEERDRDYDPATANINTDTQLSYEAVIL